MNILGEHFRLQEKSLGLQELRLGILTQNIANTDTPNFKARDINFSKAMRTATSELLNTTQNHHITSENNSDSGGVELMYRVPLNASFDGNTVESSVEQANYGKTAADFQASLTFFESRVASIRKALRGE